MVLHLKNEVPLKTSTPCERSQPCDTALEAEAHEAATVTVHLGLSDGQPSASFAPATSASSLGSSLNFFAGPKTQPT